MKDKVFKIFLIYFLFLTVFSSVVSAQINSPNIKIDESELILNGIAGEDGLNATIHIKEVSGETDVHNINIYSYDLIDDQTGKRITSDQVEFDKNGFNISKKGMMDVIFSISGNTSVGTYKGKIFVAPENADEKEIPVTVKIKVAQVKINEIDLKLNGIKNEELNAIIHIIGNNDEADIRNINFYSYDLVDDQTGKRITSDKIKFDKNNFYVSKKSMGDVKISMGGNIDAGAYKGKIFIVSENAEEKEIPITVNIKDSWIIPLQFIILGLLFSVFLTIMPGKIKEFEKKETINKRINYLRKELLELKDKPGLLGKESSKIMEKVGDSDRYLKSNNITESENKINEAFNDFINLDIEGIKRKKIDLEERKSSMKSNLESVKPIIDPAEFNEINLLLEEADLFLKNDDLEDAQNSLDKAAEKIKKIHTAKMVAPEFMQLFSNSKIDQSSKIIGGDLISEKELSTKQTLARFDLKQIIEEQYVILKGVLYVIVILIAALSGLQVLYANDISYGAKGFIDYSTAFLWGFGADQTKERILSFIKS